MWAQRFIKKETRTQVPTFRKFLTQNHDLLKLWFEDSLEAPEDRMTFPLRILRFLATTCLLFIFVYAIIYPRDVYYDQECKKR